MDKQSQDKLWNELSEENKKKIQDDWQNMQKAKAINDLSMYGVGKQDLYIELFGTHNLNPEPQIKTWEDVAAQREYNIDIELNKIKNAWIGYPICDKMIATAKIAKLIDLGYGGMVSEEEWEDIYVEKWCIIPCNKINDIQRVVFYFHSDKRFIAFHTEQQAEEFMSHESNRKLVEQYYMM